MKIYFNASMSAMPKYHKHYERIVKALKDLGHEVMDEHIMSYGLRRRDNETADERKEYYSEMKRRIKRADIMVAEISYPSTVHVGHEMTLALEFNTPVLALYHQGNRPVLFWGMDDDQFVVEEYSEKNLEQIIATSLDQLSDHMDTRFNFFISPRQLHYLDQIAKTQRIPRSVFLRRLIEHDMEQNAEYSAE